jgi:hypothetical protein
VSTNQEATATAAKPSAASMANSSSEICQLKSFTQTYGPGKRVLTFAYQGSTLQQVAVKTLGQDVSQQVSYRYNGQGRIDSIRATPGKSGLKYEYDAAGNLVAIEASGSFMPRKFTYNSQGQITKQELIFNHKPFTTTEYSYDGQANPVEAKLYDQSGKLAQTLTFRYDNKANPMVHLGALVNPLEMLYGYPVANHARNLIEVTTTYHQPLNYSVDGQQIKEGTRQMKALVYKYNQQGYPLSLTNQKAATAWQYVCK